MKFVNRREELAFLERCYAKKGFQFVPLHGRRRVGKTRLVREFIRDKRALYFMADSITEGEQLRNLARETGDLFSDPLLAENGYRDWYQFFRYIKEKAGRERLIVVIDGFPYLVNANHAISSIFQKGIDEILHNSPVFLILLGSSIGMMEREVLFSKAPLYGRRTASLEIKEMNFAALQEFFPHSTFSQRLAIFGVVGAVPAYLERVENRDITAFIREQVLDSGSFLYNEVEFLLREELREPRSYFVILRSIAQGKRKLSEIINDTGFDKTHLSRYLDILRSLRLVEKEVPITEQHPDKSRLGLYRIHDRFFSFWFRNVFPYRSRLELGDTRYLMTKLSETFEQYLSFVYEDVCRELCHDLLTKGIMNFTAIGRWWWKNEEIDLVALDEENNAIWFGECKWSAKQIGEDIYADLRRKAAMVDWGGTKRVERFILFSKNGFTAGMRRMAKKDNVVLVAEENLLR